jgi:RNA polymerase sigma factor (TIGR02999 family)
MSARVPPEDVAPAPGPPPPPPDDLTLLLGRIERDPAARQRVFEAVYRDLRRIAGAVLHGGGRGSIQPTDLLHSAFVKLVAGDRDYATRQHFFAVAGHAMRQVLVDHVRARDAAKRGGELKRADASAIDRVAKSFEERGIVLLDLDAALARLEAVDADAARMAVLVLFAGLSRGEAAELLGIPPRSAVRVWAFARSRLERWLHGYGPDAA